MDTTKINSYSIDFHHRMIIRFFFLYSLDHNSIKTIFDLIENLILPLRWNWNSSYTTTLVLYEFDFDSTILFLIDSCYLFLKRSNLSIWNNWNKKENRSSRRRFKQFILFGNESVFMLFRTVQILCLWNPPKKGNKKNSLMDWYLCADKWKFYW